MQTDCGLTVLRECEAALRQQVAQAADAGDYEAVVQLAGWARTVADLASPQPHNTPADNKTAITAHKKVSSSRARSNGKLRMREGPALTRKATTLQRKRGHDAVTYPKFIRLKNELVKIGWSKKEKREYHHRAPRVVLDCLSDQLIRVGASGNLFTTQDLFPLRAKDGAEVPSYQAYLALAWLREIGLLEQHGRQGYTLQTTVMAPAIEHEWSTLLTC